MGIISFCFMTVLSLGRTHGGRLGCVGLLTALCGLVPLPGGSDCRPSGQPPRERVDPSADTHAAPHPQAPRCLARCSAVPWGHTKTLEMGTGERKVRLRLREDACVSPDLFNAL